MHILCPHCKNPIELVRLTPSEEITCDLKLVETSPPGVEVVSTSSNRSRWIE